MAKKTKPARLNIRRALDKYEVSGYELAKRLGKSSNQITRMFKDDYNPRWSSLVEISLALECPVEDLFEK